MNAIDESMQYELNPLGEQAQANRGSWLCGGEFGVSPSPPRRNALPTCFLTLFLESIPYQSTVRPSLAIAKLQRGSRRQLCSDFSAHSAHYLTT